jgi:hypothetical protein
LKKIAAVVVVEEEGVVEGHRLAGQLQVLLAAHDAVQDQVGEDALLLLPPRLAVVEGEAVQRLAGLPRSRSMTSYQPPRCWSLPIGGMISAILRAKASYSSLGAGCSSA